MIDLRSDTVTQPTPAMREAMRAAPLGDDVFGDDPSVNRLQEDLAARLGFEAALFMPTGTQSNLCALMAHCQRGDEYIVGQMAHTYRWEGGGAAVLGSIQPQPLPQQPDGSLLLSDIEAHIKPDDAHFARTRLLTLENTIGGKVLAMDYLAAASALAQRRGLARHLDGARLFNAAVAVDAAEPYAAARQICSHFDSVSVCFSKGLGAPVGSVLCGSRDFIKAAHRWRKMAGGGLRQAGLLAAAAHHALDHHVHRLAEDHALARRLADGLAAVPGLAIEAPQTNIVFADVADTARAAGLLPFLKERGVLATGAYASRSPGRPKSDEAPAGGDQRQLIGGATIRLRFVTHLDVDAAGVDRAIAAVRDYFNA